MTTVTLLEGSVLEGIRQFTGFKGLLGDHEFDGSETRVKIWRFGEGIVAAVLDQYGNVLTQQQVNFSFVSCMTLAETLDNIPVMLTVTDTDPKGTAFRVKTNVTPDVLSFEVVADQPIHYHT